jgi:cytochrome c553
MIFDKPTNRSSRLAVGIGLFVSLTGMGLLSAHAVRGSDQQHPGKAIFMKRCTSCHGAKGEGTKAYPKALTGDKSVGQLATFIHQNMPPGPARIRKWVGDDHRKVAAYLHDAFYSPLAQARNRPARIELSRLTVRQYRNAVADLIGSFRPAARWDEKRGLRGKYFATGRTRGRDGTLERVDPEIRFDFGTAGAIPEQSDPYQFAMHWEGSVLAPETGEYDFVVRTEHAARLWVNDLRRPLIDAGVQSGSDTEHRGSLFLLGGRAYPLRLEFTKGVVGVNDLKKLKEKPPAKATLSLEWKPPKRADGVIPVQYLLPVSVPETFAVAAPFPPDDRSIGYERGTSVSKAWEEATTEGAIETARYVTEHLSELSGAADDAADREARLRQFCRQFAVRAFRRPLGEELERLYVAEQFQGAPDLETAVKRVVLLVLKSPRFLYREIGSGAPDAYDVASRLSFGLWDSLPDDDLLMAAVAGALSTREQVIGQAERMAQDPRAWSKLREFLMQWLKVEQGPDLGKDKKLFPRFDETVASDLRTSLELFLEHVAWSERSDFRELLLSEEMYLNGRLAKLYGGYVPPDAPFQRVRLNQPERAGVLTHPYLMASFAYQKTSSPIHRGVLISRSLLGRVLQPPPQAFTPIPVELHPNLTTRQRVALQTKPAACSMSCHSMINPLGFTLEKFDAIGRLRAMENGRPIDATGSYQSRTGQTVRFSGARSLARYLAGSEEAHAAFVEKLFQHLVKQPVRAHGPQTLTEMVQAFAANEFSIRKQMVEIMAASALKGSKSPNHHGGTEVRRHTEPRETRKGAPAFHREIAGSELTQRHKNHKVSTKALGRTGKSIGSKPTTDPPS